MIAPVDFTDALKHLARAMAAHPDENWRDATSDGQLRSKLWLVETLRDLNLRLGDTLVVGGWLGFLPMLLRAALGDRCGRVAMIDLDCKACRAADALLRAHASRALSAFVGRADAFAIDYAQVRFDRVREDGSRQPIRFCPSTIIKTS